MLAARKPRTLSWAGMFNAFGVFGLRFGVCLLRHEARMTGSVADSPLQNTDDRDELRGIGLASAGNARRIHTGTASGTLERARALSSTVSNVGRDGAGHLAALLLIGS